MAYKVTILLNDGWQQERRNVDGADIFDFMRMLDKCEIKNFKVERDTPKQKRK